MTDRRLDIYYRIIERVRVDEATGCWIWTGPTSGKNGRGHSYPRMSLDGQTVAVHRVLWTHFNGYIPGKKTLDHTCRTRPCVNPNHLELVTHKQNCKRRDQNER